jgi:eukaryotic-like serine/threonine-protein kinase
MALAAGTRLGPYEILEPIGAGGMGEVYRAHDSRVGRDVAIKVAAEQFSDRFAHEIHAVAALNHSNVCTLYDVGSNCLVMELVAGPTLADRIRQGAIPLGESLEIARQIAAALEAAHEKGIVHRDLKLGNIKIRPDGTVKVLDFGLAKVEGTPLVSSGDSPTLSASQTAVGVILGTAAYMSPEQAKGKAVDMRADIWAFGVVLYEMLTGRQLFTGETVTETLAAILKGEPDWQALPAGSPIGLLRRCLEKDPKRRLRDIGDAALEPELGPTASPARQSIYRQALVWVLALIAVAALVSLGYALWNWPSSVPRTVTRLSIPLPPPIGKIIPCFKKCLQHQAVLCF